MVEDLDTSPLRISVTEEKLDKKNLILLKITREISGSLKC